MANIVNEAPKKPPIPMSEQTRIIEYVVELVKNSSIFAGIPVSLNFVDASRDCVCVRLGSDNYKTAEYIDGTYEAQISFTVIYRRLNVSDLNERLDAIDLVNRFGEVLESMEEFTTGIAGVEVNSISQREPAGLIYRDNSGIEDNGTSFVLIYDKN